MVGKQPKNHGEIMARENFNTKDGQVKRHNEIILIILLQTINRETDIRIIVNILSRTMLLHDKQVSC